MYQERLHDQTDTAERKKVRSRKRKLNKSFVVLFSLILLLSIAVGATFAYLISGTEAEENSFVPGKVDCYVTDDYKVSLTDGTNVPTYVRVAIVATWQDGEGNVYATANDVINVNVTAEWQENRGYYYYPEKLVPGETIVTPAFSTGFTYSGDASGIPEGYELCVEVHAEAIQAIGRTDDNTEEAYQNSWNAAINRG